MDSRAFVGQKAGAGDGTLEMSVGIGIHCIVEESRKRDARTCCVCCGLWYLFWGYMELLNDGDLGGEWEIERARSRFIGKPQRAMRAVDEFEIKGNV